MSELIKSASNSSTESVHIILKTAKFILISYVVSFVLLVALALVFVYTDVPEALLNPMIIGITLLAALWSAYASSKLAGSRGWLFGGLVGGINVFILNLLGTLLIGSPFMTKSALCSLCCGIIAGMVGGILGVNAGNK